MPKDLLTRDERAALRRKVPTYNDDPRVVAQALVDCLAFKRALERMAPVPTICDLLDTWRTEPVRTADECADELEAALNRLLGNLGPLDKRIQELLGVR